MQSLASPTLCAKKDVILAKFDALLRKLGSEVILSYSIDLHVFRLAYP